MHYATNGLEDSDNNNCELNLNLKVKVNEGDSRCPTSPRQQRTRNTENQGS